MYKRKLLLLALPALIATISHATVYTWTGSGGDGDWTNSDNWDGNGVPVDFDTSGGTYSDGLQFQNQSDDTIIFSGATAPTNAPGLGGGHNPTSDTPILDIRSGGTFDFSMVGRETAIWRSSSAATDTIWTFGDGVGTNDVIVNLSGLRYINRNDGNTTTEILVNADATLNLNLTQNLDFSNHAVRPSKLTIAGGVVVVNQAVVDLEVAGNLIEFTELGGTFTANYGGQYADFAAIQNAVNAEVYWGNDAGGLLRVEDNGTSYTVSAVTNVITVTNSGFDLPAVLADGAVDVGVVDAWTESGGSIGVFNPSTSFYRNTDITDSSGSGGILGDMDSPAALFFASDTDQTIIQTLTESIIVGETYALTVAIGDRDAGDRAGFAGYEISLLVDGVAVATRSSDVSPADGAFTDVVLVYTAQPGDSGVLGIRIGTSNAGAGKALDVDHVRLIYSDPPFIRIDTPQDRQIAQRDSAGQAQLSIDGTIWGAVGTEVQVRALAINGNGTDVDWVTLDAAPTDDAFTGGDPLTLDAGWYQLEVRLLDGATVLLEGVREHCGVGDIFITAGQSNSANFGQGTPSAADDRVSYLGLTNELWIHADDPGPNPSGFAGTGGSPWPKLGDLLAAAHDVPIGFVQIGYGGSSVLSWTPAENDHYLNLKDAVETLGVNGFKAILWHQGERDAATSAALYAERLETVIAASRVDAGWQVPWGVALVSYTNVINPSTIEGQQLVIDGDPDVFAGAATDTLVGLPYRTGVHFLAAGLTAHAELWYDAINAFFPGLTVADFSLSGTTTTVSFTGLIGEAYAVEMRESLTVGDWLPAVNVASLRESPFSVDVNSPSDAAFFRVRHQLEQLAE